jgi:tRNA (guanine26-N2/guanine27-N2)-dimethyltransferase
LPFTVDPLKTFAIDTSTPKCIHCRHRVHIGGPVWSDPIHDLGFVACVKELVDAADTPDLKTRDRIVGMLTLVEEELPNVPLYYVLDEGICGALHCFVPPALKFRSAFLNAGFRRAPRSGRPCKEIPVLIDSN